MTSDSPDGANAPLLGQVVAERYFVEKHLGEGGMGTVYRARHITLEKLVALKVLHGEFSRKQELIDRFLQEAKAASRIRNAHVIDITDFGLTGDGYVFFAMEYLEGKDLHGLLKETTDKGGLLPWPRALDIFLQVCEALAAAHAAGIIHRDLKPENIFLVAGTGREDYVKLLDFGIAKVESAGSAEGERKLTKTGMLFGTPEYMAPEQARGEKPDHRVDVYAMGCMLFQFLTGTVPFKAESFMAILTQHMVEPVPVISPDLLARSGAPREILAVVQKALEKDRDKRYGSMVELAAAVFDASNGGSLAPEVPATNAGRARINRPTYSAGDWTGSIRQIDEIDESGVVAAAPTLAPMGKSRRLLVGAGIAALASAGAVAILLGGSDEPPADAKAQPSLTEPLDKAAQGTATQPTAIGRSPDEGIFAADASVEGTTATEQGSDMAAPTHRAGAHANPANAAESGAGGTKLKPTADVAGKPDKAVSKPGASDPKSGEVGETPKEETPGDETPGDPELMRPPGL